MATYHLTCKCGYTLVYDPATGMVERHPCNIEPTTDNPADSPAPAS